MPRTGPPAAPVAGRPADAVGVHDLPAAASARVGARLRGPRYVVPVLHRGRDAVYVDVAGWALGVVAPGAVRVPCALVPAADVDLGGVVEAEAGEGALHLHTDDGTLHVRPTRVLDVTVPRLPSPPAVSDVALLRSAAEPAREELGDLVRALADDPDRLLGRGSGLTPLGDDVVAGWAAASYALGAPVAVPDARGRTTLLSATLLDAASRGEVLPAFRDLVAALARRTGVAPAATALAAVGHTSGAGLLLGAAERFGVAA